MENKVALLNMFRRNYETETIKSIFKIKRISKKENFDFNGYIEGNKITDGNSNVIITDGYWQYSFKNSRGHS